MSANKELEHLEGEVEKWTNVLSPVQRKILRPHMYREIHWTFADVETETILTNDLIPNKNHDGTEIYRR